MLDRTETIDVVPNFVFAVLQSNDVRTRLNCEEEQMEKKMKKGKKKRKKTIEKKKRWNGR